MPPKRVGQCFVLLALAILSSSCATSQSRFVPMGERFQPRAPDAKVRVFQDGLPDRPFERIARLDAHFEKTHFIKSGLNEALKELKRQARRAGAHAIVEIKERRSRLNETQIYHVTATGIRYIE